MGAVKRLMEELEIPMTAEFRPDTDESDQDAWWFEQDQDQSWIAQWEARMDNDPEYLKHLEAQAEIEDYRKNGYSL